MKISGTTQLLCLLGSPAAHSISPAMHNEAFRYHDLDYAYLAFDVKETELPRVVEALKIMNVRGFNLTMPNKNRMCSLCDRLSPAAEISGAVNTVLHENGVLTGYTTDGVGYMRACADAGYSIIGKKMTLFGAGGAAMAILVQAALDGVAEISLFTRDPKRLRTKEIVGKLTEQTACKINLFSYEDQKILGRELYESQILTNGTNLGMAPNEEQCILPDTSFLHQDLIVSDIIYNPRKTRLMRLAESKGCPTFNGLYMLLYQGAEAFRIWTGKEMPTELIKEKYFQ
jgi:quinate/shikimate dehydrogenase